MYTKLSIPERLKDLRVVDKHLTLEQLAEQTGLSRSALGKYESDDYKDISPFAIATLADFYGVSADYLMGLTDNKEVPNADVQSLHLNDEMIELLRSGKINNRLLCELATHLTKLLENASKGRYSKEKAIEIREAARVSIGSNMPAKSLELKHTLHLISELDSEISEIESEIKQIMDQISSPILTIPGIGYRMGAMILAEIGDFSRFDSPDKILAYAGASPSTYQSGQLESSYSHMEKRGSRYLRFALINAAKYVCHWDETFGAYLQKKISEGKHYNVAITHATKKLVRLIYAMEKSGKPYRKAS